jgi:hypothetical protein
VCHAAPPQSVELALISAGELLQRLAGDDSDELTSVLCGTFYILYPSQPEISADTLRQVSCMPCSAARMGFKEIQRLESWRSDAVAGLAEATGPAP